MSHRKRKKKDRPWVCAAETAVVRSLLALLGWMPLSSARWIGRGIGRSIYALSSRVRRRVLGNLETAFGGERSHQERIEIGRRSLEHLGESLAELAQIRAGRGEPILSSVTVENLDVAKRAAEQGKGVFLLTAHLGNWELMALLSPMRLFPLHVVARALDNPRLDRLINETRCRTGNVIIDKREGLKDMLSALKKGGAIGILLDQNVARDEGVFVEFFKKRACTNKSMALLAARTGAIVLPVFIHREAKGHRIVIGDPIPTIQTGDAEQDVHANTSAYTAAIEKAIREHPDEWLWGHNRWQTRPESNDE